MAAEQATEATPAEGALHARVPSPTPDGGVAVPLAARQPRSPFPRP